MLDDGSARRIERVALDLLRRADALSILPTPLEQLDEAAGVLHVTDLDGLPETEIPSRLRRIMRRLKSTVLGAHALNEHTIYLASNQPLARRRFTHGHELGHRALPWQHCAYMADNEASLSPHTNDQFEVEANRFSAELLFQARRFATEAADDRLSLEVPVRLAVKYGTSLHASIRRYVETSDRPCGLLVFGNKTGGRAPDLRMKVLYAVSSRTFSARFGPLESLVPTWLSVRESVMAADAHHVLVSGSTATGTATLDGTSRGTVRIKYEALTNQRQIFVLVVPSRALITLR